ncbi:MAG: DUF3880 domain-containing protein [Clostridiales bacterium]|nr:DUF3880 domain-containing protein [Roseburia sp.]MDD7637187.1 DUF3880 domain-containing protein [Clostridiales bacterium]
MRILFYQWHSFMNEGVERAWKQLGIEYDTFFFQQTDWESDTGIVDLLERKIKENRYDMVFSINYAPLVSMVCEREQLLYVSWVYDAPIHIRNTESMKNSCNRIFFFDRMQAEEYARQGIAAYHMPLAADVETFERYGVRSQYQTDISLVGKLYQTEYNYYLGPLSRYLRGYLDGIIRAQMKVYGGYFLGDLLDDALLHELNECYGRVSNGDVSITREELEYMMACEITGRERYLALALLSNHHAVKLYSTDKDERLDMVEYMGYADYYKQMPEVFKSSKINLNISLKIIQSGIPLRVFDVLGCGGFLLTNFQAEMPECFSLGEDFVVYESIEDLYAKADFYLRNESERNRIAKHGLETVRKYYTFRQQMEKILREVEC